MKQQVEDLLAYHNWANRQVCDCAESLTNEQYNQEHTYSEGSVANQLFHLMSTDWFTIPTMEGKYPGQDDPNKPNRDEYTDIAALQARWEGIEAALRERVLGFSEAEWIRPFTMSLGKEAAMETNAWEMFVACVNHGTNHRAQILSLISQLGGKTVEQGYFFYLMQRA